MHFIVLLQHSLERNNVRKNMLYNKQLSIWVKKFDNDRKKGKYSTLLSIYGPDSNACE
jgi:hypothetical protein